MAEHWIMTWPDWDQRILVNNFDEYSIYWFTKQILLREQTLSFINKVLLIKGCYAIKIYHQAFSKIIANCQSSEHPYGACDRRTYHFFRQTHLSRLELPNP
jgi:hypothetical protein